MPAYFCISFQYQGSDKTESVVEDFFRMLISCGLVFKSGCHHSQNDCLAEILNWNQQKLRENFRLGYTEHFSHDYKQMLFEFHDFSEVRLILFHFHKNNGFSFKLIIPEDDFIQYAGPSGWERLEHRMGIVGNFALQMWSAGHMKCIQTTWECSDCATDYADILRGVSPAIEPFAIVPEDTYRANWDCACEKVARNGLLLKNDNNWFFV